MLENDFKSYSTVWGGQDLLFVCERSILCTPRLHLFDQKYRKKYLFFILIHVLNIHQPLHLLLLSMLKTGFSFQDSLMRTEFRSNRIFL